MALPFLPAAGGASIGGTIGSGTAGSVLYLGASGVLAQDNTNLLWDASTKAHRIGPRNGSDFWSWWGTLPGIGLSASGNSPALFMEAAGSGADAEIVVAAHRGTIALPTATQSGDRLFKLEVWGYTDGTPNNAGSAGRILFDAEGTVGSGDSVVPGRWKFLTADSTGSLQERLRLTSAGTTGLATPQTGTSAAFVGPVEIQGTSERWVGSTSGVLTHAWPATITSYTVSWPAAAAAGALRFDGVSTLSWAAPITVSDVTSARALNTTYANAYSNKAVMVLATVKCTTALLGGSATATPAVSTSATPTVSAGGTIGIGSGLAGESNQFQMCFVVPAGSSQNYRLDTASANGSASLVAWFEHTF